MTLHPTRRGFLCAGVAALFAVLRPSAAHADDFDRAGWLANAGNAKTDNPRASMIPALEAGSLRRGMPRSEVEALLGRPDRVGPRRMIYMLGRAPFGLDEEFYIIELDARGMVQSFHLARG